MKTERTEDLLKPIASNLHFYNSDAITLRRAFGKNVDAIDMKTKFSYLDVTNGIEKFDYLSRINFFIVTLSARQLDLTNLMNMEDYLHNLYCGNPTDSEKKKITKLFEENKSTTNLLKELSYFVKLANKNGIKINEYSLYTDLLNWKNSAYSWARKIVRKGDKKIND